jgi:hypothetical protein
MLQMRSSRPREHTRSTNRYYSCAREFSHLSRKGKTIMTSFKTLAAAALLSAMTLTPVFAQAAIQEPGAFAFYHPNADVLNGGAPTPEAALASAPPAASEAYAAMESGNATFCAQRYRSYDPASGTFLGHDGRRHRCE